ncbi:hypothetical protein [Fuchsiella alkaliacetigena]|uniref:hypothetical protein n=1 Tax=Fuchsiella alkaliacetigena TaxID=957042 RepID=UPI00200B716B|nr:hypothetical protein [Fuchsiella alkaliacetigena]MCK8825190.1 hypothetical protein [Fuchsiella alkaliacetigena]
MNDNNSFNFSILTSIYNEPCSQLKNNNFYLLKFEQLIKNDPQATFNHLFFSYYYPRREKLKLEKFEKILRLIIDNIYLQVISYLNYLQEPYQKALKNLEEYQKLCTFIKKLRGKLRRLLEEMLKDNRTPRAVKGVVKNGLHKAAKIDAYAQRKLETAQRDFDGEEIAANLSTYLENSEALADLAYFSSLYFTKQELIPIQNQLENKNFNQFTEEFLKKELLTPSTKEKILNELQEFIDDYPLYKLVKQAYAIYLTLGKIIPWEKHPFIKRLVFNSYVEAKVSSPKLSLIQKK